MRTYGWSLDYVRLGMTGAQSWVWYNWAIENEMSAFGLVYKRKSDGYIRQEINRLVAVAKAAKKKK
jgi:hypothetical protein